MINEYISNDKVEVNVKQSAKDNAKYCGDSYYFITTESYFICVLADGLGSGQYAHESSDAVIKVVEECHHLPIEDLLSECNSVLLNKRGAAVAVIKVFFETHECQFISVGNIRFFMYKPSENKVIYPLPISGYLSGKARKFKRQTFSYEPHARFIIFSDGMELKEIKSYISKSSSIAHLSEVIWNANVAHADDVTFIMGSLLQ
ncbi:PP2C family serine/threonine-protein phosphatase [Bacillus testis]|uniref:PP2C family serine/threonine-protein phosphatase n=1 Tax=Bacillus testis TaxID=1622072 RepID=UPI00067EF3B2|nr:PP2C family serine/threonine-protein phosphatase [Bacillus testis]